MRGALLASALLVSWWPWVAVGKRARVDVDAAPCDAFGLEDEHGPFTSEAHAHGKHQILYAASGTMTLSAGGRCWTLPPERAAWIAAGTSHVAASATGIALRTVYLAPGLAPAIGADATVFAVTPLAREMILHAMRWGPADAAANDPTRTSFFRALAGLAAEWVKAERPFYLPEAKTPELARAMEWTGEHLEDATVEGAARAARVSVRTLSRRFEEEAQTSFRSYLQAARMMRAMELLAAPRASVTAVAFAVGFRSLGAFTTAFTERCGETPSEYRARVA